MLALVRKLVFPAVCCGLLACSSSADPVPSTAEPGLVFHYPAADQIDVPLGARVVASFSDPIDEGAVSGGLQIVGPEGPVTTTAQASEDGATIFIEGAELEPGTTYEVVLSAALAPEGSNVSAGSLFSFTTRKKRPRVAPPTLISINGSSPEAFGQEVGRFRPLFETSTLRVVFSEPLDPRTVIYSPGAIELVNTGSGESVPALVVANGIHVSIDPHDDLDPGANYQLVLGSALTDLGGRAMSATTIDLSPTDSRGGAAPNLQTLRTRLEGDPGPERSRAGAVANQISMNKPLIGKETLQMIDSALTAELGDPQVLGGPIAFVIRRGQRLKTGSLDVKLGGLIPLGLSTGDIEIEFLTDAGGRIFRSPHQAADQVPNGDRAILYVDLSFDVAVTGTDATGNAVLSQTVLGVQATGTAIATEGVLAIETVATMELDLLGITDAPTSVILELITDLDREVDRDIHAPVLSSTYPADGSNDFAVGSGIEIAFNEPIDLATATDGMTLVDAAGNQVAATFEQHGSVVVLRPLVPLTYANSYTLSVDGVTDVAGNRADTTQIAFTTPNYSETDVPLTLLAVHPGVPCALTDGNGSSPGRCASGRGDDDLYSAFTLPANQNVEITFSQPPLPGTVALGTDCTSGSVRIEEISGGQCIDVVAGTLIDNERGLTFIPDEPWTDGKAYRLTILSGDDDDCDENEICSLNGEAASFDPLDGTEDRDAGGEDVFLDFIGAPATKGTFMYAFAGPATDVNGSGFVDGSEVLRDENRAALRVDRTEGDVDSASFDMEDCIPATAEIDGCMYMFGAMPVTMDELTTDCPLPTGESVEACLPVTITPQAMYATSMAMDADAGISISTETGTIVMRIREPANGTPLTGYIIDDNGVPTMIVQLELYMDAPDMSIPLSDHDLESKPLSLLLKGPVSFFSDGRLSINLANVEPVEVKITIDAPLGIDGSVVLELPAGEMKLQLVSPAQRGGR